MNRTIPPKAEEHKRRSERVLLRIPIEVKGKTADGTLFRESTFTLVINRNGARISLKNSLQPGDRITIANLTNEMACPFRVVGRTGKSMGEGPEWGVECLEPDVNFWGIYFPKKVEVEAPQESIDALLECAVCRSRELAQLTQEQYKALVAQSSVSRECAQCGAATEWKFGFAEAEVGEEGGTPSVERFAVTTAPGGKERRQAKRLTAKLPLRIRLQGGRMEVSRTEDISRTGACFACQLPMKAGDRIMITVGYTPGSQEAEIPARVVWRKEIEGTGNALYGVHLEEQQ